MPTRNTTRRRFGWLGTANVETTICMNWHTSPVKTLQDALARESVVGGSAQDATQSMWPKAANKLIGTRFKVVNGYNSAPAILLAMERGEVETFCGIGWTYMKLRKADWLAENKISILFQIAGEKHPDLPDIPLMGDFIRSPEDRQVYNFLLAPQEFGRPFFAPPDVPADRLAALRLAFERTLKDPAFLADAEKAGIEIQHRVRPGRGKDGARAIRDLEGCDRARQGDRRIAVLLAHEAGVPCEPIRTTARRDGGSPPSARRWATSPRSGRATHAPRRS